jgi:flagellar motility protein MotE (MotC chaperone)
MSKLRLIPVVVFAALCLLAIKTIGFMGTGNAPQAGAWNLEQEVWKRVAGGARGDDLIITGSAPAAKAPAAEKPAAPEQKTMAAMPTTGAPDSKGAPATKGPAAKGNEPAGGSASEKMLIERLQERRKELEARSRDLELRESLIKAAEKQLDGKIGEASGEGKDGEAPERIKSLVIMYESMGPKEAAKIFDRLESKTLVELVHQMNPRKVSEIMAKMQPEAAERMTLELARGKTQMDKSLPATDLRRIAPKGTR